MPRKEGTHSSILDETLLLEANSFSKSPQPHSRARLAAPSTSDRMSRYTTLDSNRPTHSPTGQIGSFGDDALSHQRATFSTHVTARDLGMLAPLPADPEGHARAAPLVRSRGPSDLLLRNHADSSPTNAVRRRKPRPPRAPWYPWEGTETLTECRP